MVKRFSFCLCVFVVLFTATRGYASETQNFDAGWQFHLGDIDEASKADFDDTKWRTLDLPHDWSIELPFDQKAPAGGAGAFIPTGTGWYRKHFKLPNSEANQKIFVDFDGVTSNADVYINGHPLGHRPYFGISFGYEITPFAKFDDADNVLAVRVDNSRQPASRWYTGSGINRHVHLRVTDAVHFENSSLFITTPTIADDQATVHFSANVVNEDVTTRPVLLAVTINDSRGEVVGSTVTPQKVISAGESGEFSGDAIVKAPHRWDAAHPALYTAVAMVKVGTTTMEVESAKFGIREYHFDPDTGFWLNGKNFKLKGVCVHEDLSALGTAVPMGAWRQRLLALRELGVNAIRTAHNPPARSSSTSAIRWASLLWTRCLTAGQSARFPMIITFISKTTT